MVEPYLDPSQTSVMELLMFEKVENTSLNGAFAYA